MRKKLDKQFPTEINPGKSVVAAVCLCMVVLVEADNASYLNICPFIESLSLCPVLNLCLVAKILLSVSKNCH